MTLFQSHCLGVFASVPDTSSAAMENLQYYQIEPFMQIQGVMVRVVHVHGHF